MRNLYNLVDFNVVVGKHLANVESVVLIRLYRVRCRYDSRYAFVSFPAGGSNFLFTVSVSGSILSGIVVILTITFVELYLLWWS